MITSKKPISPDLFGIFFEDLNWAADGGLYAELVQNRSFEYSVADNKDWDSLTSWELLERGGGMGAVTVETVSPLNDVNRHYAVLTVKSPGVALRNTGFDGIPVTAGESYDFSVFAKATDGSSVALTVRLESKNGTLLGESSLPPADGEWSRYTATLTATGTDPDARLAIVPSSAGTVALDVVSLFPHHTFHNHGLRADLAQAIADLKPKFVRFPGGCLAHGDGLDNMYRWKDTIGPIEQRKEQRNIWHYHQSVGLGYYEYFQFCEDIGAKPLPVVAAGVCCQNSGASVNGKWGQGQLGLPMSDMPAYIDEVLDLIEWANGPVTSTWGAKRAAQGHPEPFHLEYLGVGNEDAITEVFRERYQMISDAVKVKHPEITVIGTVGPDPSGSDFDAGWKIANELGVEMVDEHGYKPPQWYWENVNRFDAYDRSKSKVYLGEYAAHEHDRANTLRSALAEAAYMTSLERNGDIVRLSSYAPLLAREGHTQWRPDMIYFTGTEIVLTPNYYAQQLFACNHGDAYLPNVVTIPAGFAPLFASSCVADSQSGDVIVKLVNGSQSVVTAHVELSLFGEVAATATRTDLAGDPDAVNIFAYPKLVIPVTTQVAVSKSFSCEVPPSCLTVIRLRTR